MMPSALCSQLERGIADFLRASFWSSTPGQAIDVLLDSHYPDLKSPGSRRHAIHGAMALGLVDRRGRATVMGETLCELMAAVGFEPGLRIDKRRRFIDAHPPLAAVARVVFLRQPIVRVLLDVLGPYPQGLGMVEFHQLARVVGPTELVDAFFLQDPSEGLSSAPVFNGSTVYQYKQCLWHSGILSTKAHPSAARGKRVYAIDADTWCL